MEEGDRKDEGEVLNGPSDKEESFDDEGRPSASVRPRELGRSTSSAQRIDNAQHGQHFRSLSGMHANLVPCGQRQLQPCTALWSTLRELFPSLCLRIARSANFHQLQHYLQF
jgi:hypothetical protein